MNNINKDLLFFALSVIINLISAYLFFVGLINPFSLLIIVIVSIIIFFITSIQIKNSELEQRLYLQEKKFNDLSKNLKIYERLAKVEMILGI